MSPDEERTKAITAAALAVAAVPILFALRCVQVWAAIELIGGWNLNFRQTAGLGVILWLIKLR